ncbi:MAG: hypothetical protein HC867_03365 [Bacteroidia bacterium]|nr:hypothetical protein [Bacteroidia bacterium]
MDILEPRAEKFAKAEGIAVSIVEIAENKTLYILGKSQVGNFDGLSFHISTRRNEILRIKDEVIPGAFYITDSVQVKGIKYEHFLSFSNYFADPLMLVKIPENISQTE